jgi:hypothetical protein
VTRVSRLIAALVVAAAACRRGAPAPEPGTPEDLAAYLRMVAGADEPARRHEVASWLLDEPTWGRIVVEPFRGLWADYAAGYEVASAPLVERMAATGAITARRHFAGDPALTRSQARLRWTVPVLYPSAVAELAGSPIDTVFVFDGTHWRALAGLDELVLARVRALDPACGARLSRAGPTGHCTEVAWAVVDAAIRAQSDRFGHACALAATLCGNGSP